MKSFSFGIWAAILLEAMLEKVSIIDRLVDCASGISLRIVGNKELQVAVRVIGVMLTIPRHCYQAVYQPGQCEGGGSSNTNSSVSITYQYYSK